MLQEAGASLFHIHRLFPFQLIWVQSFATAGFRLAFIFRFYFWRKSSADCSLWYIRSNWFSALHLQRLRSIAIISHHFGVLQAHYDLKWARILPWSYSRFSPPEFLDSGLNLLRRWIRSGWHSFDACLLIRFCWIAYEIRSFSIFDTEKGFYRVGNLLRFEH